ncbi:type II toxin-antitoxin system Phd/YefM family antitoxin [Staphylococcus carnosus]|uniref:Antitoxin n=2 Tax=Staphylococcus carnosus TaxID=1281 RepID=B9DKQ3_STACT|nr:type II toxin-antitoxin system Phd/YefM family antitoxin [Staphylococcus carnosus]ANZ34101.1 prevent-host-death protein [Staphylococcus carnosus]KKB25165.1 prevent-host-death protein [Staphylococcus carnosus]KOR14297.1 prevent-host-death protein [Staphylococcus carnosus]PNZ97103.1 type II toxin-antitoxin system Phd/YefM family antitoxin [Staphylococcus carnosus]QPT03355.1 type II toxin-antitoxin system Phd/YefM family antitoxin [Staphylococcus carnosus]
MAVETYSNARKNFRSLIKQVNENSEAITITTNEENAVLMSETDYNAIMETLYLQQNPANAAHLKRSIEQLEKGDSVQVEIDE